MNLFDASALLCHLQGEPGADVVEARLSDGGVVTAVNWSEIAQKVRSAGGDWTLARALLLSYDLRVEPVVMADGEAAAHLWRRGTGLSLADRICLAVGERLGAVIWTADAAWGESDAIRQVR
ncbi:MAG: PIN domain-containing protein [Nocardioidaceae bacterium]